MLQAINNETRKYACTWTRENECIFGKMICEDSLSSDPRGEVGSRQEMWEKGVGSCTVVISSSLVMSRMTGSKEVLAFLNIKYLSLSSYNNINTCRVLYCFETAVYIHHYWFFSVINWVLQDSLPVSSWSVSWEVCLGKKEAVWNTPA